MITDTIPTYIQSRWSLAELFPALAGSELEDAFNTLAAKVESFASEVRPELNAELPSLLFMSFVHRLEEINKLASRLGGFAQLSFAADTQDQQAQSLLARIEQFSSEMQNELLFFNLWWKDLPEAAANRLMATSGDYRYWLEEIRHYKPHTLSEPEEKVINIKNVTGASALVTLYDSITNRYVFKMKVNGEEREMTRGELMVYARHHDPELRAQAYQEQYRVYGNDGPILGQIYQTIVRDWRNENVNLRNFKTPMAARNLANDIPDEVVDTLLNVCQKNSSVFQRFFRLKAQSLGMDRLRRYDIYAPLAKSDKKYAYDKAARFVLETYAGFDPQLASMAKRVFDTNHLDSEVRKGKRGGAFCATLSPDLTPWVLLNYQGRADDMQTMAHELGHAIHSMLAEGHTAFTQQASLPLAETASTFGEMVLTDRLLREETDETVRRDILFRQLDDNYATIQRQAYFALFERQAHEMIHQNASVDELSTAYLQNLKDQFGDAVDVSDEFQWEWVSIPHIHHTPFYVYAYTFGQLLVLALYQQFRVEGESFKPRYARLLAAGGSQAPVQVLADAGIDVRQAAFWQGGYDVLTGILAQLEAMPKK